MLPTIGRDRPVTAIVAHLPEVAFLAAAVAGFPCHRTLLLAVPCSPAASACGLRTALVGRVACAAAAAATFAASLMPLAVTVGVIRSHPATGMPFPKAFGNFAPKRGPAATRRR